MWRRQLPARSPLSIEVIASGVHASLSRSASAKAAADVERHLTTQLDAREVLLTDSGTTALALALRYSDSGAGRPVAVPAYGCFDIATAVRSAAVPFVLYDLDPRTLAPDMESLRRAFQAGADRMILVHLYGVPGDWFSVADLAAEFGARIIEDAAQAVGALIDGVPAGARGTFGVLSFGRGKGLTGGRGGALIANDPAVVEAMYSARGTLQAAAGSAAEIAKLVAQWALGRPGLYRIPASLPFLRLGDTVYKSPSSQHHPSAFSLGALSRAFKDCEVESDCRRSNASRIIVRLDSREAIAIQPAAKSTPGFLRLPVMVSPAKAAASVAVGHLGIMPGYPCSLSELSDFGEYRIKTDGGFPGAGDLVKGLLTAPVHGAVTGRDIDRVTEWLNGRNLARHARLQPPKKA